jgi:hypothetical protein
MQGVLISTNAKCPDFHCPDFTDARCPDTKGVLIPGLAKANKE